MTSSDPVYGATGILLVQHLLSIIVLTLIHDHDRFTLVAHDVRCAMFMAMDHLGVLLGSEHVRDKNKPPTAKGFLRAGASYEYHIIVHSLNTYT